MVFWASGIHPFNSPLPFAQNENFSLEQMTKETWKYAKGTLHSHSAIAPFGSPNTVYAVRSLHFALPYFAPFHSAKHRIY